MWRFVSCIVHDLRCCMRLFVGCWMLSIIECHNGDVWARWVLDRVYCCLCRGCAQLGEFVCFFISKYVNVRMTLITS